MEKLAYMYTKCSLTCTHLSDSLTKEEDFLNLWFALGDFHILQHTSCMPVKHYSCYDSYWKNGRTSPEGGCMLPKLGLKPNFYHVILVTMLRSVAFLRGVSGLFCNIPAYLHRWFSAHSWQEGGNMHQMSYCNIWPQDLQSLHRGSCTQTCVRRKCCWTFPWWIH